MISHGFAKLIRSRDGKIRELHLIDAAIQDTGLEEVRQSYLEQMVNSRKTCYKEHLYNSGGERAGCWRWRLKYCSY